MSYSLQNVSPVDSENYEPYTVIGNMVYPSQLGVSDPTYSVGSPDFSYLFLGQQRCSHLSPPRLKLDGAARHVISVFGCAIQCIVSVSTKKEMVPVDTRSRITAVAGLEIPRIHTMTDVVSQSGSYPERPKSVRGDSQLTISVGVDTTLPDPTIIAVADSEIVPEFTQGNGWKFGEWFMLYGHAGLLERSVCYGLGHGCTCPALLA